METILIRKGLKGFRYAACGEHGNLLFNANTISSITAHWKKEKQDGTIRFLRELDRYPAQPEDRTDTPAAIARRVKETRIGRGYTQKEAAELIGIPLGTYENIEKGTKTINRAMAAAIAIKLRGNTNYILTGEGRKLPAMNTTTEKKDCLREQITRMLQNIHDNQFRRELLLTGLVESEQKAYEDLTAHSDDYRRLVEKETRLGKQLDQRFGSSDPVLCEYMETVNDVTSIYGDEMYLRGIQDAAILLTGMITAQNVRDITGGTFRGISYDSPADTLQEENTHEP